MIYAAPESDRNKDLSFCETEMFFLALEIFSEFDCNGSASGTATILLSYCSTTRFTFLLVKCPSSLWTQCHYNKSRLLIIINNNNRLNILL